MTSNKFVDWLKGFLTGREELSADELNLLKTELEGVEEENALYPPALPVYPNQTLEWVTPNWDINTPTCKYPQDCGMPEVWHGTQPHTCTKCGNTGTMPNIVYCQGTGQQFPEGGSISTTFHKKD